LLGVQLSATSLNITLCVLIAVNKGHTEAEKIASLLFFIGEHVFLTFMYWRRWKSYLKDEYVSSDRESVRHLLRCNLVLGGIASAFAIAALIYEMLGKDFVLSLWVSLQVEFFLFKDPFPTNKYIDTQCSGYFMGCPMASGSMWFNQTVHN
jgi:hypothetical protein